MTLSTTTPIVYPESDGKPLADNTIQFRLIATTQGGIDALFADDPNVFVIGDLLWYPVQENNKIRQAPDVMVVFGRPKGDRGSYLQWEEENIPPQVVFEFASPGNTRFELEVTKLDFYQRYGVEEYYLFYPNNGRLLGWLRQGQKLEPIPQMLSWESPWLGITFRVTDNELELYRPDGEPFLTYAQLMIQKLQAQERAEQERVRADQQEALVSQERGRADQQEALAKRERARAERERVRAEQERARAEQAERQLQEAVPLRNTIPQFLNMGLSVEQVAKALGISVDRVREFAD